MRVANIARPREVKLESAKIEILGEERFIASRMFRFLVNARSQWQGDLDRYLIAMCFIVLKYSYGGRSVASGNEAAGLTIQSISDMTGIPRESTRRKVEIMLGMGDLVQNQDKTLSMVEVSEGVDIVQEILSYRRRFNL